MAPDRETAAAGPRRGRTGVCLLDEVHQASYTDSDATFDHWLAQLKAVERARPAACRFETDPGEQAQLDWSPYTVSLGGENAAVIVYSLLLAFCRRVHRFPSLAENSEAVFEAVDAGFRHFGGVCRSLLVDNAKVLALRHHGSHVIWNSHVHARCGYDAVQPIAGDFHLYAASFFTPARSHLPHLPSPPIPLLTPPRMVTRAPFQRLMTGGASSPCCQACRDIERRSRR